jgi:hypothetical protein
VDERYDNISKVLAAVARSGKERPALSDVKHYSGLTPEALLATLKEMAERGWAGASATGMHLVLTSAGKDRVGEEAQELLAFDIAEWIRKAGHQQFAVGDLPEDLRRDEHLMELALNALEDFGAGRVVKDRRRPSEFIVDAGIRMFGRTIDTPRLRPLVQVHSGDVVGGDKNTIHGSGAIVTGSGNTVSQQFDVTSSFRQLISDLRNEGGYSNEALDALEGVTAPGVAAMQVAAATEKALTAEPRLMDKLRGWVGAVTSNAAGTALFEAIKFGLTAYLAAKGLTP